MKNSKILNYIFPLIYLVLCLVISFNRIPFWDEARSWLIAQNCNFFELLDMMKLEAHTVIWYLIISPFAKLNLFYPYSIYVINTFFAFGAVFVLFKKSPLKIYEKLLITFSVPFLFLWGTVARCYSIGIFFLFLALAFYKDRFKKPYVYVLFLMLSANTSIMALIGVFFLALIFIFETRKEKYFKNILAIFLISMFIIFVQIYAPHPDYMDAKPDMTFLRDFIAFLFNPIVYVPQYKIQSILISILRLSVDISTVLFIIFAFKNNKKVLFYLFSTYTLLIILFSTFYSGNFWHYFYFYLYMITAFWILRIECDLIPKKVNLCFLVILVCFMFKGALFIDSKPTTINDSSSKYKADVILNEPIYKNKKIFCLDYWGDIAPSTLPYLKGKVDIYDINGKSRFTYGSMRSQLDLNNKTVDPDVFCKHLDKDSLVVVSSSFLNSEKRNPIRVLNSDGSMSYNGDKCSIKLILYKEYKNINLKTYLIKVNKTAK